MSWTTRLDLKKQVQRLWDRGTLLTAMIGGTALFPKRLTFKSPTAGQQSEQFANVQEWITDIAEISHVRIVWQTVQHRILGTNQMPVQAWVDTLEDALALIGKQRAGERFRELIRLTGESQPALFPLLEKRPHQILKLADQWAHLLAIVDWLQHHPRPGIYLRQLDLPGIHTKFIEQHRSILAEMCDLLLSAQDVDTRFTGVRGFSRRYGFLDKPARVRFRLLGADDVLIPGVGEQDFTVTADMFSRLPVKVQKVFVTENEINFLAFPPVTDAMVIFGAGYGFEQLAAATWLAERNLYYWGDIDTHGFAILNQLRLLFPNMVSLLMDEATLLAHRTLWGTEPTPENSELTRLTPVEQKVYDQLRWNHWGENIRLEQERIGFRYLQQAIDGV
ncbi:DUF3322 domain-containing protein [Desulfogranum japonicum]|uniref:DUF3322 domain-containing protein n=1 Tax=Desulfogranum japonicum TaxID=231447 RepID=UPI00041CA57C|nr:DUF3322 domain-containing protein [Desulfogranum japonicum]